MTPESDEPRGDAFAGPTQSWKWLRRWARLMTRSVHSLLGLGLLLGCRDPVEESVATSAFRRGLVVEAASPAIGQDALLAESVGPETLGGIFTPLLRAGSRVPCEVTSTFSTAVDNQDQITVTLYRGTSELVRDNHFLGRFRITGLPPAPRGIPQIEVQITAGERELRLLAWDKVTRDLYQVDRVE